MQIICYDMDENQIIACLGKFHSRAGIIQYIGAHESEYTVGLYLAGLW